MSVGARQQRRDVFIEQPSSSMPSQRGKDELLSLTKVPHVSSPEEGCIMMSSAEEAAAVGAGSAAVFTRNKKSRSIC